MPFKSGKSPKDLTSKVGKRLVKIQGKQTEKVLTHLAYRIGGNADFYVPTDTLALLNSREIKVKATEKGYRATIGYYQSYAGYLHESTNWSPKPVGTAGKKTGAYNPNASARWIEKGVQDTDIKATIKEGMTL